MEYTQKQQLYISKYMQTVADILSERLTKKQYDRALSRLQAHITEQINGTGKVRPEDIDVLDVIRKMGTAQSQAAILLRVCGDGEASVPIDTRSSALEETAPKAAPKYAFSQAAPKKKEAVIVWLGVFSWLAVQWNLPVWALRILAVLVGAVLLPILLFIYMGVYFWLRLSGRITTVLPLSPVRLFFRPLLTVLMIGIIHFGALYAVTLIYKAHDTWLDRAMPDIAEWAWFEMEAGRMFFWVLFLLFPLALFSAMPLANAWDYSLKRLTQACVVLYAIAVSFGVATFVTGIILDFVREFTGR